MDKEITPNDVRAELARRDMTQAALARRLRIDEGRLSRILHPDGADKKLLQKAWDVLTSMDDHV